eukprot:COSAG02_NODE_2429_length_8885_cov_3.820965_5_plen_51_part_00
MVTYRMITRTHGLGDNVYSEREKEGSWDSRMDDTKTSVGEIVTEVYRQGK